MIDRGMARAAAEQDGKAIGALVVAVVVCVLALGGSCAIGIVLGLALRGWGWV